MAKTSDPKASKSKTAAKPAEKPAKTAAAKPKAAKPAKAKAGASAKAPPKAPPKSGHDALVENARRALELKKHAQRPSIPDNRTPNKGMPPLPNPRATAEGSLDAEGARPPLDSHKDR